MFTPRAAGYFQLATGRRAPLPFGRGGNSVAGVAGAVAGVVGDGSCRGSMAGGADSRVPFCSTTSSFCCLRLRAMLLAFLGGRDLEDDGAELHLGAFDD